MALETLPYELLLQVLSGLEDLTTLDSLLRASPASYRIFDSRRCATEIFESILATGCVCDHVEILIRQVALLRAQSRPFPPGYTEYTSWPVPPGVASFRRQVVEESMRHSSRQSASAAGFTPSCLDRNASPAVLRSLLMTARRITVVSVDCVAFYLERLERYITAGAETVLGFTLPPPVWTEEQRCTRTLWRLQLISDLKEAATNGTLGWAQKELRSLDGIAAIGPPEDESLLRPHVSSCSQHWSSAGHNDRFFYHSAAHHDYFNPAIIHPEKHEHATVMDYIEHIGGHDLALRVNQGSYPPTVLAEGREVYRKELPPEPLLKDHSQLLYASAAIQHYETARSCASAGTERNRGPVLLGITVLRHAGFALWSDHRLRILNDFPDLYEHTQHTS